MSRKLLAFLFVLAAWAQTPAPPAADPYAGTVKKGVYSNPFFGFSCEMPRGVGVSIGTAELRKSANFLVNGWQEMFPGLDAPVFVTSEDPKTHKTKLTVVLSKAGGFVVLADQRSDTPSPAGAANIADSSQASQPGPNRIRETSTVTYGGRVFQMVHSFEKTKRGKKHLASLFLTESKGYTLRFAFVAEDEKKFANLLKVMETLRFDPATPQ